MKVSGLETWLRGGQCEVPSGGSSQSDDDFDHSREREKERAERRAKSKLRQSNGRGDRGDTRGSLQRPGSGRKYSLNRKVTDSYDAIPIDLNPLPSSPKTPQLPSSPKTPQTVQVTGAEERRAPVVEPVQEKEEFTDMSGWLTKTSKHASHKKDLRHFRLSGNCLSWHKNKGAASKALGEMTISGVSTCLTTTEDMNPNVFSVRERPGTKTYFLTCTSDYEKAAWVKAVEQRIRGISHRSANGISGGVSGQNDSNRPNLAISTGEQEITSSLPATDNSFSGIANIRFGKWRHVWRAKKVTFDPLKALVITYDNTAVLSHGSRSRGSIRQSIMGSPKRGSVISGGVEGKPGSIPLSYKVSRVYASDQFEEHGHCLVITANNHRYYMCVASEGMREQWIHILTKAIAGEITTTTVKETDGASSQKPTQSTPTNPTTPFTPKTRALMEKRRSRAPAPRPQFNPHPSRPKKDNVDLAWDSWEAEQRELEREREWRQFMVAINQDDYEGRETRAVKLNLGGVVKRKNPFVPLIEHLESGEGGDAPIPEDGHEAMLTFHEQHRAHIVDALDHGQLVWVAVSKTKSERVFNAKYKVIGWRRGRAELAEGYREEIPPGGFNEEKFDKICKVHETIERSRHDLMISVLKKLVPRNRIYIMIARYLKRPEDETRSAYTGTSVVWGTRWKEEHMNDVAEMLGKLTDWLTTSRILTEDYTKVIQIKGASDCPDYDTLYHTTFDLARVTAAGDNKAASEQELAVCELNSQWIEKVESEDEGNVYKHTNAKGEVVKIDLDVEFARNNTLLDADKCSKKIKHALERGLAVFLTINRRRQFEFLVEGRKGAQDLTETWERWVKPFASIRGLSEADELFKRAIPSYMHGERLRYQHLMEHICRQYGHHPFIVLFRMMQQPQDTFRRDSYGDVLLLWTPEREKGKKEKTKPTPLSAHVVRLMLWLELNEILQAYQAQEKATGKADLLGYERMYQKIFFSLPDLSVQSVWENSPGGSTQAAEEYDEKNYTDGHDSHDDELEGSSDWTEDEESLPGKRPSLSRSNSKSGSRSGSRSGFKSGSRGSIRTPVNHRGKTHTVNKQDIDHKGFKSEEEREWAERVMQEAFDKVLSMTEEKRGEGSECIELCMQTAGKGLSSIENERFLNIFQQQLLMNLFGENMHWIAPDHDSDDTETESETEPSD